MSANVITKKEFKRLGTDLSPATTGDDILLPDSDVVYLGTGKDGELFHDGTNTYFQNNTGGIIIENDASDGDISFKVNDGGVDKTVMTLDGATGNVGIGTTSPGAKLEVNGDAIFTASGGLKLSLARIDAVGSDASRNVVVSAKGEGVTYLNFYGGTGGVSFGDGAQAIVGSVSSAGNLAMNGALTISGTGNSSIAGNVGIGTTGPVGQLHVALGTAGDIAQFGTAGQYSSSVYFASGKLVSNGNYFIINGEALNSVAQPILLQLAGSTKMSIGTTVATNLANFSVVGTGSSTNIFTVNSGSSNIYFKNDSQGWLNEVNFSNEAGIVSQITTTNNNHIALMPNGTGNVGIGTTGPTNLLSLGGNSARIFWLERHTTANTAGNTLTIIAGGATAAATDKNGGDLLLQGGLSTGTGESGVQIYGCVAGATGTADRTQTLGIQLLGNKIGVFSTTPAVQQNTIVDADGTLADITTKFNTLLASLEAYGWLKSV